MEPTVTVAEALIDFFRQNGINKIFGVVGDAVFPFFDALGKQKQIEFIGTSHEINAAFMASYHAKLTGQAGICIATSGPGAANLVNGLAEAYFDKAPVLAITGQVQTKKIGTNAKQFINQQQLLQAVTKSSELAASAESVLHVVANALTKALNEKTVTHVSIPVDLFTQQVPQPYIPKVVVTGEAKWGSGFATELEDAVMLLNSSQRPIMVVGQSKRTDREPLVTLAEKLGAGVILAQQAKGVIPDNSPHVIGGIGEAFVPGILKEADYILLIGTASFEKRFFPAGAKVIQVVDDPGQLDYSTLTNGITGEIHQVIKLLAERIDAKNPQWLQRVAEEKIKRTSLVNSQEQNQAVPLHPAHLMTTLKKALPKDAVIVCDVGGFIHWFDTYFMADDHEILVSSHWRSMGGGLPGALSACLTRKDKKVVALVGDGGLLMSLGELATAVKYQLPVTVVVANNHQYNLEKNKMESKGMAPFGYDLQVPDFAMIAKAFGAEGRTVTTPQQLEISLNESLASKTPFLIDVHLDPVPLPLLQ